jgi:hypothetical protein
MGKLSKIQTELRKIYGHEGVLVHDTKHLDLKKWQIHPNSSFLKFWDMTQGLLLVYVALVVPYRVAFEVYNAPGSAAWVFDLVVDIYFVTDIIFNFLTPIYDENGLLVRAVTLSPSCAPNFPWSELTSPDKAACRLARPTYLLTRLCR